MSLANLGLISCLFVNLMLQNGIASQPDGLAPRQALVFRPGQNVLRGRIIEVQSTLMRLASGDSEVDVEWRDIRRIVLIQEDASGNGSTYGAILGGYFGLAILDEYTYTMEDV